MWTPKRILILIAGTFVFLTGFVVYDYFLGGYNGLPPLPEEYMQTASGPILQGDQGDPDADKKMRIAFGAESEEARRPFILDSGSKGMLLAVHQFEIEPDGRVKLSPFSVALFPKKKGENAYPEVNTIQSEMAYLTLDRPVSNFTELSSRRIIGLELRGSRGVTIINNRRTSERNDDLEVSIKLAPVYYEERSNKIWTEGFVKLLDTGSQPHPTEVTAKGMVLQLAKDNQPLRPKSAPAAKKSDGVGGVEFLDLKSHVEMHLYVDAKSGFLNSTQDLARKPAATPPAGEKAHVMIKTAGSMHYDLTQEQAVFDSPAPPAGGSQTPPEQVLVSREHQFGVNGKKWDQLVCDSLKLTFRKKSLAEPKSNSAQKEPMAGDKEIESALALARPGREVTLSMDTENLEAYGSELFYACATATAGPRTELKGSPLHAIRDGNTIEALELHLFGPDKNGVGQHAFAKGPGKIDLLDKSLIQGQKPGDGGAKDAERGDKPRYTLHAIWRDNLISTKDRDGDRVFDLLTLTGDAAFIDDEHKQSLSGQRLQVWLEQSSGPKGNKQQAGGGSRQKPHKVEAFDRVAVQSPEMQIDKCHHLVVIFKEVVAVDDQLPPALPEPLVPGGKDADTAAGDPSALPAVKLPAVALPVGNPPPPVVELRPPQPDTKTPVETKTPAKTANDRNALFTIPGSGSGDKDKPRKPIRLSAHEVVAYISTQGTKKQLQELVTEGDVRVLQDGDSPKTKGMDITGEMLNLIYHPLGNRVLVYGDTRRPAQLQVGELTLIGPKVDIDQKDNTALVDGTGAMKMPSDANFDGGKPAKKGTYVTIHWNKDMLFNGKFAEFHGGVQAFQDNASLKCQSLQVTLDRMVSFKEGQKENQNAKVEKLVCDKKVWVEDKTFSVEGKFVSQKRLVGAELDMDNQDGRVNIAGPGRVYNFAHGETDWNLNQPIPPKNATPIDKTGQELMLTRVDFEGRMFGSNKPGSPRLAKFYDNVEVFHQPASSIDVPVSPNQPPKNGFYLRCNNLSVSTQERDGKTSQAMVAKGNAFFRTTEFYGNADEIKYDEGQETIIFEGNPTTLFKLGPPGSKAQRIEGKRILYNRKNGTFSLGGGTVISSWLMPENPPANGLSLTWIPRRPSEVGALAALGQSW